MQVDLSLAVNYLPACACLCKVLVFVLLVGLIQPGEEVRGGYIPLAAMLYLDRLVTRNMIFDANAILLAVYFANVHAAVRATSVGRAYTVFEWGLHMCWIGFCITLVMDPAQVRWFFEKRVQASKLMPVVFMLSILVGTAYLHAPLESAPVRACRALAFTLLSFAWVYVIGIHSASGIEYLKETSSQFIVRLAPVLYSPIWLAAVFVPAVIAALVAQYHATYRQIQSSSHLHQSCAVEEGQAATVRSTETPEDLQLHELFRQAKMTMGANNSKPASAMLQLDAIPE